MKVIKTSNYREMSSLAARLFLTQIQIKKHPVIALPTGSTPLGLYEELIRYHKECNKSYANIITFNLDEYYPIKKEDSNSYYQFMMRNFFNHVDIKKENIFIPNGECSDPLKEAKEYEQKIKNHKGIDLAILGVGVNGHIGFNEPGTLIDETHLTDISSSTARENSRFFNNILEVPTQAITMGMKTIASAEKIIILANGSKKMDIVDKISKGNIDENYPATLLNNHKNATLIYTPYER